MFMHYNQSYHLWIDIHKRYVHSAVCSYIWAPMNVNSIPDKSTYKCPHHRATHNSYLRGWLHLRFACIGIQWQDYYGHIPGLLAHHQLFQEQSVVFYRRIKLSFLSLFVELLTNTFISSTSGPATHSCLFQQYPRNHKSTTGRCTFPACGWSVIAAGYSETVCETSDCISSTVSDPQKGVQLWKTWDIYCMLQLLVLPYIDIPVLLCQLQDHIVTNEQQLQEFCRKQTTFIMLCDQLMYSPRSLF